MPSKPPPDGLSDKEAKAWAPGQDAASAPSAAVLGALAHVGAAAPTPAALHPVSPWVLDAMAAARALADEAAAMGEVPVGAVVVFKDRIIARAHNRREIDKDPLAHAEILALRLAAQTLDRWRLTGCTLVVTLEPCPMCAGAIVNSRVDHVVFGAWDAKAGAVGSLCNIVGDARLNHRAQITPGVEADEARAQLQAFFAARRRVNKRSDL